MAAHPTALGRFTAGPLHGLGLALYFLLLPYVVLSKWSLAARLSNAGLIRGLLVALSLFWLLFLFQFVRNVLRLRRGLMIGGGGSAWLAGLVVAAMPFLITASSIGAPIPTHDSGFVVRAGASAPDTTSAPATSTRGVAHPPQRPSGGSTPIDLSSLGALPLALMAKRRSDVLRDQQLELGDDEVDETVALLRATSPGQVARVRHAIGDRLDGVVSITGAFNFAPISASTDPVAVCVLKDELSGVVLSFAREGGRLRVPAQWSDADVIESTVALHEGGRLRFAREENELLHALATRSLRSSLVIYLGHAGGIDDDLRACSVTIEPAASDEQLYADSLAFAGTPTGQPRRYEVTSDSNGLEPGEMRVELLRAAPRVVGLDEPFTATLRRRCVEMVAYLALHRHEPVTGDRLRTRVLTHADVDASARTLANTASAVRRSLGVDAKGPRLHPVTSSGLYVTHAITSDVEIFHSLTARARQLPLLEAAPFARRALSLVRGEPLASALRGFEWFLAEGYAARLLRDGEWASLALHRHAMDEGDYELAFWALSQGRLIDPYSDALTDALTRVPRLRQFGGDGAGRSQDQSVGTGDAVAVRGSFQGLGDEVGQ